METVASDGWMLTNQRAIAHSVEEVSHASEREIQFYSPGCTASFGEVFAWHFWQDLSIDSVFYEQQRRSCSAFHYILVQYKRRTMHQNTLIAISLRCNPLSSIFFPLRALYSSYYLFCWRFQCSGLSHSCLHKLPILGKLFSFSGKSSLYRTGSARCSTTFRGMVPKTEANLLMHSDLVKGKAVWLRNN